VLNVKVVSWSLGIWSGLTFIICVIYGLLVPESLATHQALGQALPGFRWLTVGGFVIGLGWSIVYGLYAGWLFSVLYNGLNKRWTAAK
jgi:uncharacterized protein DUF5676